MKNVLIGLATGTLAAVMVVAPNQAQALTWPDCSAVTQPTMPDPVVSGDAVRFVWTGGSYPTNEYFAWFSRKINGEWAGGSWVTVGRGNEYTASWVDGNGVRSEAVQLDVFIYCTGSIQGPKRWVYYSEWEAIEAQQKAEAQAAIDAEVAKQLAEQQSQQPAAKPPTKKKRVECVSVKTDEIKMFARWKCPKGWKKY